MAVITVNLVVETDPEIEKIEQWIEDNAGDALVRTRINATAVGWFGTFVFNDERTSEDFATEFSVCAATEARMQDLLLRRKQRGGPHPEFNQNPDGSTTVLTTLYRRPPEIPEE